MEKNPASSPRAPKRTCTGCRKVRNKEELLRVVRTPEGSAAVDRSGKADGRGAYICRNAECAARAKKTGALQRTLRIQVPDEVYEELSREVEEP
jgi:hypothetical protein